ncbi:MAG: epimerase [Rhodobacteraceae bacterium]|nr:epimerase [Paracoccaceae bacterium]
MTRTVLILGASGRFGHNAARAFEAAGWTLRRFDRTRDSLQQAAQGVDVIVNAWNPAYPKWARQVPDLQRAVQAAARATDALVIVPGNVYVFGAATPAPWSALSAHAATNPLGRIRIEMERGYRQSGVRTLILRSGDFLDTRASGNWFDSIIAKSLPKGVFTYPGRPDVPHAWAYLPDLARATVALAGIGRDLPTFCDVPFEGYTMSGDQMAAELARVTGRPLRLKRMSWLPLRLAAPVWPMGRSLIEMSYLWNTPHSLSPDRFAALLPGFRPTPPNEALAQAISWQA